MHEIHSSNRYAVVRLDYETCRARLLGQKDWGADVLSLAGDYGWRVKLARRNSRGAFSSQVIEDRFGGFIAWVAIGQKSFLAYRIEPEAEGTVRVTPLAYVSKPWKIAVAVPLAVLFVFPVLLAPLIWRWYALQTFRASRVYLPAFCRYLIGRP